MTFGFLLLLIVGVLPFGARRPAPRPAGRALIKNKGGGPLVGSYTPIKISLTEIRTGRTP